MNQKNKTFEESMQRLEQIVRTMERAGVEWLQPSQRAKASEVPTNKG